MRVPLDLDQYKLAIKQLMKFENNLS